MAECSSVKQFFSSHHIKLSNYWLESCIQWYKDENPNVDYSIETLNSVVYEQWLLLDLRDVEVPILPPNLAEHKKTFLNDVYCLQILHVQDISQPKLVQLHKIRTPNVLFDSTVTHEQDQYPKLDTGSKRMLQLLLTDGVQQIEAIEYKPINVLNVNIKPGTKIKITGPVQVRRGQIMLETKHVHLLGGEVEEILIVNSYENVLARALKLPENAHPAIVEEPPVPIINQNVRANRNVQNSITQYTININTPQETTVVNFTRPPTDFEEALITDEVDMLLEAERDVANDYMQVEKVSYGDKGMEMDDGSVLEAKRDNISITKEEALVSDAVDMLLESERDIANDYVQVEGVSYCDKGMEMDNGSVLEAKRDNISKCIDLNMGEANDNMYSMFEDIDIDAHLDIIDNQQGDSVVNCSNKVVSIAHLLENKVTEGQFLVRAQYKKVVQKLSVTDEGWTLLLLIGDESGELEARVDSTVVSNLIGYEHTAVMAIRKNVINKDENVTAALMKGVEAMKNKIIKINGEMLIVYTTGEKFPVITKIM
ncbi:hypothetical protein RI129_000628 [Pyrocoelia pectoralis]|uniref:RecQ-mediated genome instability protein 1 n=1 Tax=Pyrocoelia pectoralis TaxID=417401 RepID=A0AAN7VRZ9_9COLE